MLCVHWKTQQHVHTNKTAQTNSVDAFWLKILKKVSEKRWEKTFNFKIKVQKDKVEIQSWKIKKVLDRGNVLVAKNLENQVDRVAELRGVSNTSTYGKRTENILQNQDLTSTEKPMWNSLNNIR